MADPRNGGDWGKAKEILEDAGFDYEEEEEVAALFLRVPPSLKAALQKQAEAEGFATFNAWAKQNLPRLLKQPTCQKCGKSLPPNASPYWLDEGQSIWLCEECAR